METESRNGMYYTAANGDKIYNKGEKVVIEGQAAEGFIRVVTGTGAVYIIPSHIIKKTS